MNKLFILMFCMILLVGAISAEEFTTLDNIKQYDEETKTVTIVNTFGAGRDIATIKLNTPLVNVLPVGYQKIAEFPINLFDDTYSNAFKEMVFINNKNKKIIDREFDYKYLTTEEYEVTKWRRLCEKYWEKGCVEEYTETETREVWKDLDTSFLYKGEIIVGIFTEVRMDDNVEWIPNLFGKEIDEWASFVQSSGNVTIDGNFTVQTFTSNGTFNVSDAALNISILVVAGGGGGGSNVGTGNAGGGGAGGLVFNGSKLLPIGNFDITIGDGGDRGVSAFGGNGTNSIFDDITAIGGGGGGYLDSFNGHDGGSGGGGGQSTGLGGKGTASQGNDGGRAGTTNLVAGGGGGGAGFPGENVTSMNVAGDGGDGLSFDINGTSTFYAGGGGGGATTGGSGGSGGGGAGAFGNSVDGVPGTNGTGGGGGAGQNTRIAARGGTGIVIIRYLTSDIGGINLNSPIDNFNTTNQTITFNGTVSTSIITPLVNVSLILNGVVNETNTSGINGADYIFTKRLSFGSHNWTYESCDNESICSTVDVRDFSVLTFIENNITFNSTPRETSFQNFELNITTIAGILSISAFLNYNGTRDISTTICDGLDCTITNKIDIPLVTLGEFENKSFFWEISAFDGTISLSTNTTVNEQNVTRIRLEECGGAFTTQAMNFTAHDEQNLSRIDPFLFEATFDQWLGNGSVKRQSNFSQLSTSDEALCISPDDETYFIDAIIEYDEAGNASLYTLRNYYFQNDTINNVSVDTFLYLLLSSESTSFILKVQDDSLLPLANHLIEINRFYPGTNEFRIVQIARTDDLGKSVGFFETEIVDYKFLITFNNATLLETGLQKVIPETSPFTLTFNIGEPLGEPWKTQDEITDLNSSLVFNDSSGIITYEYIDTSNNFNLARLFVIRQSLVNQSNDTLICNENSSLTSAILTCNASDTAGFYVASAFITRFSLEELDLQITFQIETLSSVVGLLGLFFGWFLILIASFMFKFNEIAGIWAITITMLLVNLIGLINFGGVFVTATIAVAIILTWIMER